MEKTRETQQFEVQRQKSALTKTKGSRRGQVLPNKKLEYVDDSFDAADSDEPNAAVPEASTSVKSNSSKADQAKRAKTTKAKLGF